MAGSGQSERLLGLLLLMIPMCLLSSSSSSQATANKFYVGGKDGWVVKPSEDYNHWAQRNRFQVNDTLHFKYKKGSDLVLVVKKEDFDSCNTKSPMQKMDDGDSTFHFDNSGLFYFISGNVDNCKNGQKLIVLVMAVRQKPHQSPPPAPEPFDPTASEPYPGGPGPDSPASLPSPQQIDPSGFNSPAPSPSDNSGSTRFGGSVGVGLGVSVGVILIFTSFAGLV